LVRPTDRRLPAAGLLVSQLRGESYYRDSCRAGDFRPGQPVQLVPEPDNPHDDRAVAVFDATGRHRAGYMNKQKARAYLKRIAEGKDLTAISLRGADLGVPTPQVAILAAAPDVVAHLLSPRPPKAPAPAGPR
ncbi:HIRAN domain-containing protein, partial [Geodermatophilus maliterrae]